MEKEHFFELDDGGGYSLRGHGLKLKVQRGRLQPRQGFRNSTRNSSGSISTRYYQKKFHLYG